LNIDSEDEDIILASSHWMFYAIVAEILKKDPFIFRSQSDKVG
jgi:hypothetical protein